MTVTVTDDLGAPGSASEAAAPWARHLSTFERAGDALYFDADDGIHGRELWSYSESGLYRAVPYSSVAGEGLTSPLG